ncbi:hypothetical protein K3757_18185 (plasmid) [Sulfitobacter sp. S223]|uniref:GLUG motif-containing protein n=1 Tax=Sulfitobacter sp. S223 TaxID=2867023 RepID=UPI0021A78771|nr:GLUG motif-containing protein [Sulfitobacter sp. S223]UWR28247.1 hypothetical protein K3757_18185 [Sulfitobacter sp. S223]
MSNSSYTGTITTTNNTDLAFSLGGLVGASAGTVDNSSFDGTIIERGLTLSLRSVGGGVGTNRGIVSNVTTAGDMQIEGTGGTLRLGGLVGDNRSFEGIAGSESNIAVGVVNPTDDEIHAGGPNGVEYWKHHRLPLDVDCDGIQRQRSAIDWRADRFQQ